MVCAKTILHIWFRSKFDFAKLSGLLIGRFFDRTNISEPNKPRENFQIILVIIFWKFTMFFQFASSKTKLDF